MKAKTNDWIDDGLRLPSARDVFSFLFRRLYVILVVSVVVFGAVLFLLLSRPQYKADMSILIRTEREDPLVTSNSNAPDSPNRGEVTEEQLNSEAELLKSEDVLRKVVLDLHMQEQARPGMFAPNRSQETRIQKAVAHLAGNLQVKPVPKTDILSVSYRSGSALDAARVLDVLAREYIAKNISVHRSSDELAFFEERTAEYKRRMHEADEKAVNYAQQKNIVDAESESMMALHRADEFKDNATISLVSIVELQRRRKELEKDLASIPPRLEAGNKQTDNAVLLQMMKSSLLSLQTKEGEMSWRFQPEYPPLRDIRREIEETRQSIATELKAPVRENATDRNPLLDWAKNQLAQTNADLAGAQARMKSDENAFSGYQQTAERLMRQSVMQRTLLREAALQAENYLTYSKRQEAARIAEELNARGIVNVTLASPPYAPALPAMPLSEDILLALLAAMFTGSVAGVAAEYLDNQIRTPEQLEDAIEVPVLAALPAVG